MARSRNIKPGFFESEQLGRCPFGARLLFAALWTLADREGKLEERPMKFRSYAFPYDSTAVEDVMEWLAFLDRESLIERYQVGRQKLIFIPAFAKHQNPHLREKNSVLPDKPGANPVQALDILAATTEKAPDKNQISTVQARLIPDSGFLIPDSCVLTNTCDNAAFAAGVSEAKPARKNGRRSELSRDQQWWFNAWWEEVWAKKDRGHAELEWKSKVQDPETFQAIMAATRLQTPIYRQRASQYQPLPATWLHGKRWLDELPAETASHRAAPTGRYELLRDDEDAE